MRQRGFEVIQDYAEAGINLPQRATKQAAGYDIEAGETVRIPSFWQGAIRYVLAKWPEFKGKDWGELKEEIMKPTLVPTGLKAYMGADEYLQLTCRSSNPLKRYLTLPNGIGIIDSDYYNNAGNEGHIYVQLLNFGLKDVTVKKGERIAQGIFLPFLKVDQDQGDQVSDRQGGFGSSGQ